METINQRILRLLGGERGAKSKLAKHLGIEPSSLGSWLGKRQSEIPASVISAIAEFLNVSDTYLLRGVQTEDLFSPEEMNLINLYRMSSKEDRDKIVGFAEYASANQKSKADDIKRQLDEAISAPSSLVD